MPLEFVPPPPADDIPPVGEDWVPRAAADALWGGTEHTRWVEPPAAPAAPVAFPLVPVRDVPEILEQHWLVEGLLPRFPGDGSAGYVFGHAKARKSLILADIALSVASGTPAFNRYPVHRRGAVVMFFAEDPRPETSRRIHRMARARGIDVPDRLYLIGIPCLALDNPVHQAQLVATLSGLPDLALVGLDPMVRLHSANDNRAEELAPIHTYLRTLARGLPDAVLLLAHHAGKSSDYRGSTDYPAFGDFNIYVRGKDDRTTSVHRIENRGGPPGEPFDFKVVDAFLPPPEGYPTLHLEVVERSDEDEAKADGLRERVRAWRAEHRGGSGNDCMRELRAAGVKCPNSEFWEAWRRF